MNYIYCFTNRINHKKYIGSTINSPEHRLSQHLYHVTHPNSSKYNYPLYCAIRKYGIDNFDYEVLDSIECDEIQLRKIEKEYMLQYNTLAPNGYNQTLNTEHPLNDPLTYAKMSETKREKAKKVAEIDTNKNILLVWRSIVDCAEDTGLDEKKIAACCRGERLTTNNRHFCWINEDQSLDIREYHRDIYKGEKGTTQIQSSSRKVAKIDKNTNEIIEIYDTIALAARENNCDNSGISKVCNGTRNSCGGFKWKYVN